MRSLKQFWSVRRIGEDRVTMARLGPLRLWLARADKEWAYATTFGETSTLMDLAQVPEDVVPEDLEWTNMIFNNSPREFAFDPVVPDRPLVVKPMYPVTIPEGESGHFFVSMPLFVRIRLIAGKKEQTLGTFASEWLSSSWFGDSREGVLCYTCPVRASLDLSEVEPQPNHALCPVEIQNTSEKTVLLEKLCLRPEHIGLYCGNNHLWSSSVKIQHEDGYNNTTVRYSQNPPAFEDDLNLVAKPAKVASKVLQRFSLNASFSNDIVFSR